MISSGLRAHISSSCGFYLSWMGWKDDEYLSRLLYILSMPSHVVYLSMDADERWSQRLAFSTRPEALASGAVISVPADLQIQGPR